MNDNGIFFVTRQKSKALYSVIERRNLSRRRGITSDDIIKLKGQKARHCPILLRRIGYTHSETGKRYVFLTNNLKLAPKTIADIYKARWKIELFFIRVKQNLKIKSFVGTSDNAVMTQIWIAMCMYLLLAFLKFSSMLSMSLQQLLRLLQLNLFERRDLLSLLVGKPPDLPGNPLQSVLKFS